MGQVDVMVNIAELTGGRLYTADIYRNEESNEPTEQITGKTLRECMTGLRDKVVELGIPRRELRILGEFNLNDLTSDDTQTWETPIFDL
jgi:hypothetical protein